MPNAHLQRGKSPNDCLGYDTKPSDGEAPLASLVLLSGPL